jgi:hypothetical protein
MFTTNRPLRAKIEPVELALSSLLFSDEAAEADGGWWAKCFRLFSRYGDPLCDAALPIFGFQTSKRDFVRFLNAISSVFERDFVRFWEAISCVFERDFVCVSNAISPVFLTRFRAFFENNFVRFSNVQTRFRGCQIKMCCKTLLLRARVTRWACEKIAQNVAQYIFVERNT